MGGDIIRSETTKCFAAKTCHEGYNPIEAELESVCVESEIFDGLTSQTFTRHFQEHVGKDPGHYVCPNAIIEFGSLSNNILCLCDRNMHGGMPGCVCSPQALKLEDCKCSAKPLLDGDMMYSMAKLKHVDSAW